MHQLDPDERKIFDLVCRRLLSAWHDDHIWSVTTIITLVRSKPNGTASVSEPDSTVEDRFHSSGTAIVQVGWKVLDVVIAKKGKNADAANEEGQSLPPGLTQGQPQRILDVDSIAKKTRAPKRFTEATLLTAMETAGKTLDDKELSQAMKENGLGTPATRAQIIEVLLKREFILRKGKSLEATDKGIRLIEVVHPEAKSPVMTGQWEAYLKRIERGEAQLAPFISGIENYVREVVGKTMNGLSRPAYRAETNGTAAAPARVPQRTLEPGHREGTMHEVLKKCFGFDSFRPSQEEVCRVVCGGRDVLLVMPTGSGKSLCYQLPGIMLGGMTLVISPLIALMEDQVAKLQSLGFQAERIHSGRDRATSREVCFRYLEGKLDFLFIAPERLRVKGFPEMLAKRKPVLVAIDEAHCISAWGHDFRPDYRNIGKHLPALRPAPVIALTATATPIVQRDIATQLGLHAPRDFIQGFRRDNIAVEVARIQPSARFNMVAKILEPDERRPAIIYAPTRRDTEFLAKELSAKFSAQPYHAGLDGKRRDQVQTDFLSGKLDVIVATIAFGMGVDKPDVRTVIHTALPGSIEGYYQEIGRAGRDGAPSRAILMQSYADRRTHDFFFERDYPDVSVLEGIYRHLTPEPQPKEQVLSRIRMQSEAFDIALEKLWIHGGAIVDYADNIARGRQTFADSYKLQREHKSAQFEKMLAYCESPCCRMLSLVRYFGDMADSRRTCGVCDFCDPSSVVAQTFRALIAPERIAVETILKALANTDGISTGRLYTQAFPYGAVDRRTFEDLLNGMARAGLVTIQETSFEKDGQRIDFRKVRMTPEGLNPDAPKHVQLPQEIATDRVESRRTRKKKATKQTEATPPKWNNLKAWRLAEAKKRGVPAFRILSDKTMTNIAEYEPSTEAELLEVPGVGPKLVEKHGDDILKVLRR